MSLRISLDKETIETFCRKHDIRMFAFFGSVLREDFSDSSDIDILVEFADDYVPGFFKLMQIEEELSVLLGKKVDLRTPDDLSHHFRNDVLTKAKIQYVAQG